MEIFFLMFENFKLHLFLRSWLPYMERPSGLATRQGDRKGKVSAGGKIVLQEGRSAVLIRIYSVREEMYSTGSSNVVLAGSEFSQPPFLLLHLHFLSLFIHLWTSRSYDCLTIHLFLHSSGSLPLLFIIHPQWIHFSTLPPPWAVGN